MEQRSLTERAATNQRLEVGRFGIRKTGAEFFGLRVHVQKIRFNQLN